MGFPTKVQLIKRKASEQWYINFPSAVAQALDFARGETVEWSIEDKSLLALRRLNPPPSILKKLCRHPLHPPAALARVPPRLLPAACRRTRPSALVEQFALSGAAHRDRSVDHLRPGVPGLVCRLSTLLPPSLAHALDLLGNPPRGTPTASRSRSPQRGPR